jgi:hypothetical protein
MGTRKTHLLEEKSVVISTTKTSTIHLVMETFTIQKHVYGNFNKMIVYDVRN